MCIGNILFNLKVWGNINDQLKIILAFDEFYTQNTDVIRSTTAQGPNVKFYVWMVLCTFERKSRKIPSFTDV